MSVTASLWRYCLRVALVTASGTVLSLPPMIRSSGPRAELSVSTLAGECGLKFAAAASNSGLPGAGIAQRSNRLSDSSSGMALPKAKRNWSAVRETARCLLAGFLNTGSVALSAESGSGSTPLIWAASMAIAAAARSSPRSRCAIIPPKECPTRIGLSGSALDDRGEVGDHVVDPVVGDGVRVARGPPRRCRGPRASRAPRSSYPAFVEVVDPRVPGLRVQPETVDEQHGSAHVGVPSVDGRPIDLPTWRLT